MATGDKNDNTNRVLALIPNSWFPDTKPILTGLISGFAGGAAWAYSLIGFAKLQMRVSTATDIFLDLIAFDYLGRRVKRKSSQTDAVFANSIKLEVMRERGTRRGLLKAITDLTGNTVSAIEPFNANDTNALGVSMFLGENSASLGSNAYPYSAFLTVITPPGSGIPNMSGLGTSFGGLGAGAFALANPSLVTGPVTNNDIYSTIETNRAAGITTWVNITAPNIVGGRLDISFVLDITALA